MNYVIETNDNELVLPTGRQATENRKQFLDVIQRVEDRLNNSSFLRDKRKQQRLQLLGQVKEHVALGAVDKWKSGSEYNRKLQWRELLTTPIKHNGESEMAQTIQLLNSKRKSIKSPGSTETNTTEDTSTSDSDEKDSSDEKCKIPISTKPQESIVMSKSDLETHTTPTLNAPTHKSCIRPSSLRIGGNNTIKPISGLRKSSLKRSSSYGGPMNRSSHGITSSMRPSSQHGNRPTSSGGSVRFMGVKPTAEDALSRAKNLIARAREAKGIQKASESE